jgi:DNA-binding GntR family transcriptional regulator
MAFTYKSKTDLVADAIRELIASDEVQPGVVLRQRELADRFEVSATPVREALLRLEAEGLVVNETHRGATVVKPTEENKAEVYAIRALLEPYAAEQACRNAIDEDLAEVSAIHEEIAQLSPDDPAITRLNRRFHLRIYECSRSSLLMNLIQQTWRTIQGGPQVVWRPHEESVSQHAAMLEALRERDGERLAKLTREHIEGAVAHMERALQDDGREPTEE